MSVIHLAQLRKCFAFCGFFMIFIAMRFQGYWYKPAIKWDGQKWRVSDNYHIRQYRGRD